MCAGTCTLGYDADPARGTNHSGWRVDEGGTGGLMDLGTFLSGLGLGLRDPSRMALWGRCRRLGRWEVW
jgi:hypothetical protein